MPKDLRTFLPRLEERAPGEFLRVKRPVDPVFELPGVVRKLQAERRYPAVLFEQVKGRNLPGISNLLGGERLLAEALGTTPDRLSEAYIEREDKRLPFRAGPRPPVPEHVNRGAAGNALGIPIIT